MSSLQKQKLDRKHKSDYQSKDYKKISLLYLLEHHHLPHFLVSSSSSFSLFSFLMSLALGWLLSLSLSFSFEVRLDAQAFPYLVCSFCPNLRKIKIKLLAWEGQHL